ncbi:MAG: hypothetical protein IPJ60_18725, partial [Sphingobacteriaceae bacterium]|nr:hypothetical protein [Sphingobacteriaceae bacterium]
CNPGGDALFMDHDQWNRSYHDGFIVGFDWAHFNFITSVNDDLIIIDEPKINP